MLVPPNVSIPISPNRINEFVKHQEVNNAGTPMIVDSSFTIDTLMEVTSNFVLPKNSLAHNSKDDSKESSFFRPLTKESQKGFLK